MSEIAQFLQLRGNYGPITINNQFHFPSVVFGIRKQYLFIL